MSNIIVECRNKDATNVVKNGEWTTTLPENITISNGDSIIIKNSFIDTQQTSSSKVLIKEDINISIDYGFYQVNQLGNLNSDYEWYLEYNTNTPVNTGFDLKNWILTYEVDNLTAGDGLITEYSVTTSDINKPSVAVDLILETLDADANDQNFEVKIPALKPNEVYIVKEVKNAIITEAAGVTPSKSLIDYGLKVNKLSLQDVTGKNVMLPYTQTRTITLPAGNYDPDDLVEVINTKFNLNNVNDSLYLIEGDHFLQSSRQIQAKYHNVALGQNTREFYLSSSVDLLSPYGLKFMRNYPTISNTQNDLLFGSSQFQMSFNQATKVYSFDYLHTPLYYQSNAVVGYFTDTTQLPTLKYSLVNKSQGIWIDRLYATNQDGTQNNFWSNIMGQNVNSIETKFTYESATAGPTTFLLPQTDNLVDGRGITGALTTQDQALKKDFPLVSDIDISGYVAPSLDQREGFFSNADVSKTNAIVGSTAIDNIDAFGYYLIEVNSHFKNNFLTPTNNYRSISQIVSRFYEVNSYTSSQGGEIIYTHTGEDLLLQSFRCRVLDSNKNVPDFIGDDNSIIIEVLKADTNK